MVRAARQSGTRSNWGGGRDAGFEEADASQVASTRAVDVAEVAVSGAWSAARMARDAVLSRDELVTWFGTSAGTSARVRQFMLTDLAGRLAEWGPTGRHWEAVRGVLGLDLDAATPMDEVPRLWAEACARQLRGVPVYIMTPVMMDVCVAAAKTLTVDDVADARYRTHTRICPLC